jgi:D-amino peptidase
MKLYISIDMEGMPGTWNWQQEKRDRDSVKSAFYNHVKDVLDALLEGEEDKKIREVVIADSHGMCDNLSYDITALDKRISLVSGEPRPFYMMPAFDKEYDGVLFLGYHAGTGALHASMDHTYSNSRVHQLWINDQPMNEALINAAYAAYYEIPVILITGDLALKQELRHTPLENIEFVVTKEAVAKFAARNFSRLLVQEETKSKVKQAVKNLSKDQELLTFSRPITLKIVYNSTSMADAASLIPHTRRLDGRTVSFTDRDYKIIFETIMAMTMITYTVDP